MSHLYLIKSNSKKRSSKESRTHVTCIAFCSTPFQSSILIVDPPDFSRWPKFHNCWASKSSDLRAVSYLIWKLFFGKLGHTCSLFCNWPLLTYRPVQSVLRHSIECVSVCLHTLAPPLHWFNDYYGSHAAWSSKRSVWWTTLSLSLRIKTCINTDYALLL